MGNWEFEREIERNKGVYVLFERVLVFLGYYVFVYMIDFNSSIF